MGSLKDIMDLVPKIPNRKDLAAAKLQSMLRGRRTRLELQVRSSDSKQVRKRLVVSLALRLTPNEPNNNNIHKHIQFCSLLIKFVSDWQSSIKVNRFFLFVFNV